MRTIAVLLVVLIGWPATGWPIGQDCRSSDLRVDQIAGLVYDASSPLPSPISVRLSLNSTGDCEGKDIFLHSEGAEGFPPPFELGRDRLQVRAGALENATRTAAGLRLVPAALDRLLSGESVIVQLGEIQPAQFVRPGDYASTLIIQINDQEHNARLQLAVLPVMRFVYDHDNVQSLDLGDISQGSSVETSMRYVTNADLRVTVSSENKGLLVHKQGIHLGSIPYEASLAGKALDLRGASPFQVQLPFSSARPQQAMLQVSVPPVRNQYAGIYRDVLRVSFTPF